MKEKAITLKTLGEATAQEVFDQVVRHLRSQDKQSIDVESKACCYRGDMGSKCAAGILISDDEYSKDFEDKGWGELLNYTDISCNHKGLIQSLQDCHDFEWVYGWMAKLKIIASEYNLTYPKDCEDWEGQV